MRVLVVTGGLFSLDEASLFDALRKQVAAARGSDAAWLDIYLKVLAVERVLAQRRVSGSRAFRGAPYRAAVERMLAPDPAAGMPELTEVLLATLLRDEGCEVRVATWSALYSDPILRQRLLQNCDCLFASTTLIRDLSELRPLLEMVRTPGLKVVVGGALVGILRDRWPEWPEIDLLAVGYGETLVPALVGWLRSGANPAAPEGGRMERRGAMWVMHAPLPEGRSLDTLPVADWGYAEALHGRKFEVVSYESVRGCPYRCAFCNYPFLFADDRFRLRSAEKIARDWEALARAGARTIVCLDSLFTVPKKRLDELCERLIALGTPLRWVCYARADDLRDPATVAKMREAGCVQVQIGVESGDQGQLDRMDKRSTVSSNGRAILNCREENVTTLTTFIIGYPGEDAQTIHNSLEFMRQTPPDFYYAAPFSTKFTELPVLSPASRERFGLVTVEGGRSAFPPWRHHTMDALGAVEHIRAFNQRVMSEGWALDGGIFYGSTLNFRAEDRSALLDFQREVSSTAPPGALALRGLRNLVKRRAVDDARRALGAA